MDDGRLDLTPLEPDPERVDRTARAVLARSRGTLEGRRRLHASVWSEFSLWERPLLAAAAAAALLSIVALVRVHPGVRDEQVATLSEQAGVPEPVAAWVDSDQPPDPSTLINW